MIPVQVVGLGMSPADLTPSALKIIQEAQVLVGGKRILDYFPMHPAEKIPLGKDPERILRKLPALAQDRRVVVLASGDPNFYGVGPLVVEVLGADNVIIHPNITAIQTAAARLLMPWHQAQVVSLHGRDWQYLTDALTKSGLLFIYTDPVHTPGAIAQRLLDWGLTHCRLCILENLGQENERFAWLTLEEAVGRVFSPLNLVVLDRLSTPPPERVALPPTEPPALHLGMSEEAFSHERSLITKAEVRSVVISKLELYPGQVLWDVGAGSGSVGLEASLLLGRGCILAVEKNPARAAQISANRDKFGVTNLKVICGSAPGCLTTLPPPDRVFIGGGGDFLGDLIREVRRRLRPHGKIVLTATRLETLQEIRQVLSQENWLLDIVLLQVSRSRSLTGGIYLQALNPVWIVAGSPNG